MANGTEGAKRPLTLVLLAAGVGSRYGGTKQLEGFGPGGETIMEYSIFDAHRAGFEKVVFVIRPEMQEVFRTGPEARIGGRVRVGYAFQRLEDLPAGWVVPQGRTKPWGTGQALLAAADVVTEPFIAANADDFYGRSAYEVMGDFLRRASGVRDYAMVGYRLADTMSEQGTVSRGVCRATADGWLESIVEMTRIERRGNDGVVRDEQGNERVLPGETRVSMNFWGFQPGFFDVLRAGFEEFLRGGGDSATAEYYLPVAVQEAMRRQGARVRMLASRDAWCGVTHRHDRSGVEGMIRGKIAGGVYPEKLWG